MLKGKVERIFLVVAFAFCYFLAGAQNEAYNVFSPYTMYGIGDISKQGTSYNKSMGGVGIATRDKRAVSILNPASVTERETQSFMMDFSLVQGNRYYAQGDLRSSNNTFNMNGITISFPVWKSLAMYGCFSPYSDLGYDISSWVSDPAIIAQTGPILHTVQGSGGLTNLQLGAGFKVFKGLSVGGEVQRVFGNISKDNIYTMTKASLRSISSGYDMFLHATTGKAGVQYEFNLSKDVTAVIGATYRLTSNLGGKVDRYEIQTISSINDSTPAPRTYSDTLGKGRIKLASEAGFGIALKGADKWTAEINYLRSDWTGSGMDKELGFANVGNAVFSASRSQSIRAGFSIVPNRNDIRYYRRRVTYRAGAYWDQAYCKVDGMDINAFGLTFGATLPVFRWSNGITLGMDIGQRGSNTGNLIRERYVNFNIGVNIFDIWFIKNRYE